MVDFLSIMPLVNTITGVPISFGGVGVRETLFQTLLGQLAHVPPALAAISATLGYVVQASWGMVGGVAYLLSGRQKLALVAAEHFSRGDQRVLRVIGFPSLVRHHRYVVAICIAP